MVRPAAKVVGACGLLVVATLLGACGERETSSDASPDEPACLTAHRAELTAAQQEFEGAVRLVQQAFAGDLIDFRWTDEGGEIEVRAEVADQARDELAATAPQVRVTEAPADAVPVNDGQVIESEVLQAYDDLPAKARAAVYDPFSESVILTVWTDDPAGAESAVADQLDGIPITLVCQSADEAPEEADGASPSS